MEKIELLGHIRETSSESIRLRLSLLREIQTMHATGSLTDEEIDSALIDSMVLSVRDTIRSRGYADHCNDSRAIGYVAVKKLVSPSELAGLRFDHGETLETYTSKYDSQAPQKLRRVLLETDLEKLAKLYDFTDECGPHCGDH